MKKNVLIPIDDEFYFPNWVDGYTKCGFNVIGGLINFWNIGATELDILHIQWPEYLVKNGEINDASICMIVDQMNRWRERGVKIIGSINNIYPHGRGDNEIYKKIYSEVYGACDLLQHFSEASKNAFSDQYPKLRNICCIVTSQAGYGHVVSNAKYRGINRKYFGIKDIDYVVMVFGALRSRSEWALVRRSFKKLKVQNKRLLITQKYLPAGNFIVRNLEKFVYKLWLSASKSIILPKNIPDEYLKEIFEVADVVVVPRIDDISSGIPGLAMTLGVMVIAPDHGAFPEYLHGTKNLLYKSGSVRDLSINILRAFEMDRNLINKNNLDISAKWSWGCIVDECLIALKW